MHDPKGNRLQHESSPYLKQHAYNPVAWFPWGSEALEKAIREDKPIIVSIGYSSCHWCHVMEKESFENEDIAALMNDNFISIKVDREERPDIDQIYMEAAQAMGINGGWPLNVFLTPGQKPFYGGTYFPPASWIQLLKNVTATYKNKKKELLDSAESIASHIDKSEALKFGLVPVENALNRENLRSALKKLVTRFDTVNGGLNKAPKFPMPSLWKFILRSGFFLNEKKPVTQVLYTLAKMASGGIYDQVGGGFARYSVDKRWFAPHFEKMLYDNGQLISLFSEAFLVTPDPLYKEVVYNSIEFLERELMNENGGFYSALDADSEGIEGKFYTWTRKEIQDVLGKDTDYWCDFLTVSEQGNWEAGKNILTRGKSFQDLAGLMKRPEKEVRQQWHQIRDKLLNSRKKRIRPGLDDKILAGWNGIALQGLMDAYGSFHEKSFLDMAENNASYLLKNHISGNRLFRTTLQTDHVLPGYLDDYAFVIQGLISLYESTFNENWLNVSRELLEYCLDHFYDSKEDLFYYTDDKSEKLISRKKEIFDNVIPASNSTMAGNLWILGTLFDNSHYTSIAERMVGLISKLLLAEPEYLFNWGSNYLMLTSPLAEIAFVGTNALESKRELDNHYYPNKVCCGTTGRSGMPLLKDKNFTNGSTTIYVCYDKTCKLPVNTAGEAIQQLI